MAAFLIALQFLTRIPVTVEVNWSGENMGKSVLFYPLIGLLIGLFLALLFAVIEQQHSLLVAAIVLMGWVMITGGLHLDGLADSADAWAGGLGDKQRTLDIMKDSRSGALAIVVLGEIVLTAVGAYDTGLRAMTSAAAPRLVVAIPCMLLLVFVLRMSEEFGFRRTVSL